MATGGLYQSTVRDASIEKAIDEIGGELHAQYTLSYRPTGTGTKWVSRNSSAGVDRPRADGAFAAGILSGSAGRVRETL